MAKVSPHLRGKNCATPIAGGFRNIYQESNFLKRLNKFYYIR